MTRFASLSLALVLGCSSELPPPPSIVHARFDPEAKVIPMPTDVLRDDAVGRLVLPMEDPLNDAEREFYSFLNTMDGWSSTMSASVEFTAPIDKQTVNADSLQVWEWGGVPRRVKDAAVTLSDDGLKITIDAPRSGWKRSGKYVVLLRSGPKGVQGKDGQKVECDAAFYFLRLKEKLDTPEHDRAFPGNKRAERMENARKLEEIRLKLAPFFAFFEQEKIPRAEVAALWSFTVTQKTELAMDKASQRMPLPIDLLIDPSTGRIDVPVAEWDKPTVAEAKGRLNQFNGFGVSSNLLFEFTAPVDKKTITSESVKLFELSDPPVELKAKIVLLDDLFHVSVEPESIPLKERSRYAVVVLDSARDVDGLTPARMPAGHFLLAKAPVFSNGRSQIKAIPDADAERLEKVRQELRPLLDRIGRDRIVAAWPFSTMSIAQELREAVSMASRLDVPVQPTVTRTQTPLQALGEFPWGGLSLLRVGTVVHGTIPSPEFLDSTTRSFRTDGGHRIEDIGFTMTIPRDHKPGEPLPVVVFGHAILTERRCVLAVGDALAAKGFAAISIDFPYHGSRTHCYTKGLLSIPDPITGKLTSTNPCKSGYECAEDGRCVDATGKGNELSLWPVVNWPQASGAAFIEIDHIANSKDHFVQAYIDLGALSRSLRAADWKSAIGFPLKTDKLYYLGQSLGSIIGATFTAFSPEFERIILNVPGSDVVDMFDKSPIFGIQVNALFKRESVERGTFEAERFLNVGRWFMDSVDPQSVAHLLKGRNTLVQMALLDEVIPNPFTVNLAKLGGIAKRDYLAEHIFLILPLELEYFRATGDIRDFLTSGTSP
ncbi:MAG: hypothetical protein HY698_04420 [Deltaproteobacteria bacterium]|nr:hypothetical protein [Deltaproteobacteria bacterium]